MGVIFFFLSPSLFSLKVKFSENSLLLRSYSSDSFKEGSSHIAPQSRLPLVSSKWNWTFCVVIVVIITITAASVAVSIALSVCIRTRCGILSNHFFFFFKLLVHVINILSFLITVLLPYSKKWVSKIFTALGILWPFRILCIIEDSIKTVLFTVNNNNIQSCYNVNSFSFLFTFNTKICLLFFYCFWLKYFCTVEKALKSKTVIYISNNLAKNGNQRQ